MSNKGKILPIDFGSSDEVMQATEFAVSLPGVNGAASVQVAVLAILGARHVRKSGRNPVLRSAVELLCDPRFALAPGAVLGELGKLGQAEVTRATKSYARGAVGALERDDGLARAMHNAVAVLTGEHLRRSDDEDEDGQAVAPLSGVVAAESESARTDNGVRAARGEYLN